MWRPWWRHLGYVLQVWRQWRHLGVQIWCAVRGRNTPFRIHFWGVWTRVGSTFVCEWPPPVAGTRSRVLYQYRKPAPEGDSPSRGGFLLKRGTVPLKRVLFTLHHDYRKKNQNCKKRQWCLWRFMCPLSMHQFIKISVCALEICFFLFSNTQTIETPGPLMSGFPVLIVCWFLGEAVFLVINSKGECGDCTCTCTCTCML